VYCTPAYSLTAGRLKVDTKTGKPTALVGADPDLAAVASTPLATETGSQPALVQAGDNSGFGGKRLLVGPSAFDNSGIASASDQRDGSVWTVDLTLTTKSSKAYDALAQRQFHAYIAIELDGTVVETSLVEPTSATYMTFGGTFEISASFTKSEAVTLADNVTSPLAVPVSLKG
jgi:preprotein translocase subunit SecD